MPSEAVKDFKRRVQEVMVRDYGVDGGDAHRAVERVEGAKYTELATSVALGLIQDQTPTMELLAEMCERSLPTDAVATPDFGTAQGQLDVIDGWLRQHVPGIDHDAADVASRALHVLDTAHRATEQLASVAKQVWEKIVSPAYQAIGGQCGLAWSKLGDDLDVGQVWLGGDSVEWRIAVLTDEQVTLKVVDPGSSVYWKRGMRNVVTRRHWVLFAKEKLS